MQSKQEVISALEAALEYMNSDVSARVEGDTATMPSKDLIRLIKERDRAVAAIAKMREALDNLAEGLNAWKNTFNLDEIGKPEPDELVSR